ncbi:MAG TPA: hypothetical protein VGH56_04365 [Solirubrobacteraceae bacterium]|jgi:hypothetical protein
MADETLGGETVPVSGMMAALAVCGVPTDTAVEVLRIARHVRDQPDVQDHYLVQDRYLVKRVANAPWSGTQWAIWDSVEETWADDLGRFLSQDAAQRAADRAYKSHEHLDLPDSTRP